MTRQSGSAAATTGGAMPELGRRLVRQPLGLAADPEQVGVATGEADHIVGGAESNTIVAVGDAAFQRDRRTVGGAEDGLEPLDDLGQRGHGGNLAFKARVLYLHRP